MGTLALVASCCLSPTNSGQAAIEVGAARRASRNGHGWLMAPGDEVSPQVRRILRPGARRPARVSGSVSDGSFAVTFLEVDGRLGVTHQGSIQLQFPK